MISNEMPRPEHPRPDRCRASWMNLNGEWQFSFDREEKGMKEKWFKDEKTFNPKILVPFAPESSLSGIHDEGLHKVCWYKRFFDMSNNLLKKRVLLHFGAVDYKADVWLNESYLGSHEGGYTPFCFDVTDILKTSGNTLSVRAEDDMALEKCGGKQSSARHPEGCLYMRVTGIWQTVWLEGVGSSYIEYFTVIPELKNGKVRISAEISGSENDLKFEAIAKFAGLMDEGFVEDIAVKDNAVDAELIVNKIRLWTPEIPNIYSLTLILKNRQGDEVDSVEGYFAFRSIETKGNRILLNNVPIFLKGALDQGYYPDGLYTPPSDQVQKEDVLWAKKYGLNFIRKHQIVAEPRFYYWCDVLGLMVWAEMPDWGGRTKENMEQYTNEWQEIIRRDINHPSVIAWVSANEWTWEYYSSLKKFGNTSKDIITYCDGYAYRGEPIVFSEIGNWRISECPPLQACWKPYGTGPLTSLENYLLVYREHFTEIMDTPDIAGFCYVQLYDTEGENNGYLTYDRKVKIPPDVIREIHAKKNGFH